MKNKYTVVPTTQFKKDLKTAKKRNMNMDLLERIVYKDDILLLILSRTGNHSDYSK